jgi:hypothetical protein
MNTGVATLGRPVIVVPMRKDNRRIKTEAEGFQPLRKCFCVSCNSPSEIKIRSHRSSRNQAGRGALTNVIDGNLFNGSLKAERDLDLVLGSVCLAR